MLTIRYVPHLALKNIKHRAKPQFNSMRYLSTDIQDKMKHKIDNRVNISKHKKMAKTDKLVHKITSYTNSSSNNKIHNAGDKVNGMYSKFKTFMKDYGYLSIITYWCTSTLVWYGAYMACRYGYISYHDWRFLHLQTMEDKIVSLGHNYFKIDITVSRNFEDIIAGLLIMKLTKPIQWSFIYLTVPVIAKKIKWIKK